MKTLGMVGGTSWASSKEYYTLINRGINERLGGLHYPELILYSLNYGVISELNARNDLHSVGQLVRKAALELVKIKAEGIILCANTLHMYTDYLEDVLKIPLIHIVDAVAAEIRDREIKQVGLLGTRYTMQMDFYKQRLLRSGIECLVPPQRDQEYIHQTIMSELIKDVFHDSTRSRFMDIIGQLEQRGAQGVILGCTEIPLLLAGEDSPLILFDSLKIHSDAAVDFILS